MARMLIAVHDDERDVTRNALRVWLDNNPEAPAAERNAAWSMHNKLNPTTIHIGQH